MAVGAGAFAIPITLFAARPGAARGELWAAAAAAVVHALIGLVGLGLHLRGILALPGSLWTSALYGPPVFAPLLFPDLAALAGIGLGAKLSLGQAEEE
ncbi:MAG TPA: hypothetical protein RMF84_06980 [Polyangiaceae bacterium LLY-WYZ-14_1]|nr:hypothetical protein [Polyangiaceae bacterium LLY-WYZ-14_1]